MKKFTFYRNLGIATIISTGLVAIAASCGVVTSNKKTSAVETEANKVTVEYTNKANVLIKDAKESDLVFSDFDKTKYEVVEITTSKTATELSVSFVLKEKTSETKSAKKTKTITGFKTTDNQSNVKTEATKVTVDYTNKADVLLSDATNSALVFSSFDKTKYEVAEIATTKTAVGLSVSFVLKDKTSNEKSSKITKNLIGFKSISTPSNVELEAEAKKVTVDYTNKANVLLKDTNNNQLVFSSFNETKYEVDEITTSKTDTGLSVSFVLKEKTSGTKSSKKTLTITGFKSISEENKKVLEAEADKVTVEYTEKSKVFLKDAKDSALVFSGFEASKYEIDETMTTKTDTGLSVSFVLKEKTSGTKSSKKTKIITGFKVRSAETVENELQNEIVKVKVDYPNPSGTNINDVEKDKFVFSGFNTETFAPVIIKTTPNNDARNITVSFVLEDKSTKKRSEQRNIRVLGFVVTSLSAEDEIARVLSLIQVAYKDAANVFARDAKEDSFIFSGYNSGLYNIQIKELSLNIGGENVDLTINIVNKITKLESNDKLFVVSGFKPEN